MVRVTVKTPQRVSVKTGSYIGPPIAQIDTQTEKPTFFGADSGGLYMTTEEEYQNMFYLGRDGADVYVRSKDE